MLEPHPLQVSHINIRLSISIMLLKMLFIEAVAAILVVLYFTSVRVLGATDIQLNGISAIEIPLYVIAVVLKMFVTIYIVIQWLNEYYEITPDAIFKRRGVIFRKEQKYPLSHIHMVVISQSVFGKIFNYGTLSLYDFQRNKYFDMYMIHNPMRYEAIVEKLLPKVDEVRDTVLTKGFDKELD